MIKKIFFVIILTILLFGATSAAYSSGYPMAAIGSVSGIDAVVVGKFNQTDFTFAEANQISQVLASALGLAGIPGAAVYTPQQLQSLFGITDADFLRNLALANYQAAGFEILIFIDMTKVNAVMSSLGQSLRADFWIAIPDLGPNMLYVLSLEIPLAYLSMI